MQTIDNLIKLWAEQIDPSSDPERYPLNRIGAGYLFADTYRRLCRHSKKLHSWFFYDGTRWVRDDEQAHRELAKALTRYLRKICTARPQVAFVEWLEDAGRGTMIKEAESVYPINILQQMDTNKNIFNCINGTIDLQKLEFREHNPDDYLMLRANVIYDPNAKSERLNKFFSEITCENHDLERYIQKLLGYVLTGKVKEEKLFILHGEETRNGKGVLMETLQKAMGDYAAEISPKTLTKPRPGSAPAPDLARLKGKRLAIVNEPDDTMKFNGGTVKQVTGGGRLSVRYLHQNITEFDIQFKTLLQVKPLPAATDMTMFFSDRLDVIPFNRHFEEHERDKTLKEKFSEPDVLSALLNIQLAGLRLYYDEGFEPPQIIRDAVDSYRTDSDTLAAFISECTQRSDSDRTPTGEFFAAYRSWCKRTGVEPAYTSGRGFVPALRQKHPEWDISSGRDGNFVRGIKLIF